MLPSDSVSMVSSGDAPDACRPMPHKDDAFPRTEGKRVIFAGAYRAKAEPTECG